MKFVSFSHEQKSKFGIIEKGKILDLTGKILGANTLKQLISNKNGINTEPLYPQPPVIRIFIIYVCIPKADFLVILD